MRDQSRIISLDILRGLSLYFILIANILVFSGYFFFDEVNRQQYSTYWLDVWLLTGIKVFVTSKFYTIFSLLFGIGFYIQLRNFSNTNLLFSRYILMRFGVLLLIGLVHMTLIWLGDILTLYALMGMLLLLFYRLSDRLLLSISVLLLILPVAHAALMGIVGFYPATIFKQFFGYVYSLPGATEAEPGTFPILIFTRTQDWQFYWQVKLYDPVIRVAILLADARFFKVLGTFVLGFVIGRHIYHHNLLNNVRLLKKVFVWGVLVGLPANIAALFVPQFAPPFPSVSSALLDAIGIVPLALAYAAAIVLLLHKQVKWLNVFAPVGRTALSNYVMQSLICIYLFYGVGLGWVDDFGLAHILLIATVIFFGQIAVSHLWLQHFNQGPLESLWRRSLPKTGWNKRAKAIS